MSEDLIDALPLCLPRVSRPEAGVASRRARPFCSKGVKDMAWPHSLTAKYPHQDDPAQGLTAGPNRSGSLIQIPDTLCAGPSLNRGALRQDSSLHVHYSLKLLCQS